MTGRISSTPHPMLTAHPSVCPITATLLLNILSFIINLTLFSTDIPAHPQTDLQPI